MRPVAVVAKAATGAARRALPGQSPGRRPGSWCPDTGVSAPAGSRFVRGNSGKVYALNPDGRVGAHVTDPGLIGISPVFQASDGVPGGLVDAVCGPLR